MLSQNLLIILSFLLAFGSTLWLHPKMVHIARLKQITDNPDKRKLQRAPVPVLGGVVVFFGIVMGVGSISAHFDCRDAMFLFALMVLMLYTGTMDDIYGLTPRMRLCIEMIASLAIICGGGYSIDHFHGLWGIGPIPAWLSVPLTVVTVVGIINAINLIDGVNGLSSGYCMLACAIFGVFFWKTGDTMMTTLAFAAIGALIPFFIHNVFGNRMRMFIGDGGTLMMGMVLSLFVLRVLDMDYAAAVELAPTGDGTGRELGLIPFTLAVLSIPIFDTLRVMTRRMLRGTSPFRPDKTHLHHAFIELGCSHLKTTLSILGLNAAIVAEWYLLYRVGVSVSVQLYAVLVSALLCTAGVYLAIGNSRNKKSNCENRGCSND